MSIIGLHSWPCPVNEDKIGTLILTEERLFYSLYAVPAEVEALAPSATDSMIAAALPKGAYSVPIPELVALRMIRRGSRFRIISSDGGKTVAFGEGGEDAAAEGFSFLAGELGFDSIREVEADRRETLRNPLLCLVLVLMVGVFFGILAGQPGEGRSAERGWVFRVPLEIAHWVGPATIWGGLMVGIIACGGWMAYQLANPARARVASRERPGRNRKRLSIAEDDLRGAIAGRLGIDGKSITAETRFEEDLKIPRGEMLDLFSDLEESLGVEVSTTRARTFGELLASLR